METAYSRECDSVIPDQSWEGITLRQGGEYALVRGAVAQGGSDECRWLEASRSSLVPCQAALAVPVYRHGRESRPRPGNTVGRARMLLELHAVSIP